MVDHPGYMAEVPDLLSSSSSSSQGPLAATGTAASSSSNGGESRRGRRTKQDAESIDITTLTGGEHVPVIHRDTGKKVTVLSITCLVV